MRSSRLGFIFSGVAILTSLFMPLVAVQAASVSPSWEVKAG